MISPTLTQIALETIKVHKSLTLLKAKTATYLFLFEVRLILLNVVLSWDRL